MKNTRVDLVRLLVSTGAAQYLPRDVNGATPLQLAIKLRHPEITRLIADAGPAEALTLEDVVGHTPLEMAMREVFLSKIGSAAKPITQPHFLPPHVDFNKMFNVASQEKELVQFRATIQSLLDEGRLVAGTKLATELQAFAERIERRIAETKAADIERKQTESAAADKAEPKWSAETDVTDVNEVLKVLLEALAARPGLRRLVHLSDVLESVQKGLEEFRENKYQNKADEEEDGDAAQAIPSTVLIDEYRAPDGRRSNHDVWRKL